MKVLYITLQPLRDSDGVTKKVYAQLNALESLGHTTGIVYTKENGANIDTYHNSKLIASNLYKSKLYNAIFDSIKNCKYDVVYLRYVALATPYFLSFLKKLKKYNIINLLEIPTYPYDGEFKFDSLRRVYTTCRERICRNLMFPYVDKFITFSKYNKIFGIPTIRISNAISVIPPLSRKKNSGNHSIKLTTVANIAFWHGYDRLIEGLINYYKSDPEVKIHFYIIGDGCTTIVSQLKTIVSANNLQEYVHFLGPKNGAPLDSAFEDTDLAIGCLGCHRKNIVEVKSLKNVEYAMRGLPFVYSENNTDFDNKPYVLKVPSDDTPINIDDLISFIKNCTLTPEQICDSVKDMTWEVQFHNVFKTLL